VFVFAFFVSAGEREVVKICRKGEALSGRDLLHPSNMQTASSGRNL